ncbi:hypothetical protein JT358_16710 [Micrococcales bacterium 31B]|nr:hypothetical protein [Micrococcales bacterium 31B]
MRTHTRLPLVVAGLGLVATLALTGCGAGDSTDAVKERSPGFERVPCEILPAGRPSAAPVASGDTASSGTTTPPSDEEMAIITAQGAVLQAIESAHGDSLAYVVSGPSPAVGFTGAAPADIATLTEGAPRPIAVAENLGFTRAALDAAQAELHKALTDTVGTQGTTIAVGQDGVLAVMADPTAELGVPVTDQPPLTSCGSPRLDQVRSVVVPFAQKHADLKIALVSSSIGTGSSPAL